MKRMIKIMVVTGLLASMVPYAGAESRISPDEGAAIAAQTELALAEGTVASDRTGTIGSILNKWSSILGNAAAVEQFEVTLKAASNKQLAKIALATSFDQVRAVLLGAELASSANGGIVIQNLGDLNQDLVFTPNNPPCRVFDTRLIGGGTAPGAGTTSSYQVYGSAATIAAQGGNTLGCTAPKGEPVAVSANFTAVPIGIQGHIRVFPYGATLPTVSFVNFNGVIGNNVANSGIISTCYLCTYDLSVYNGSQTHHIGDIMGFFYPVSTSDPSFNEVKDAAYNSGGPASFPLLSDSAYHFVGPVTTHTTTTGDRVHIVAHHALGTTTSANNLNLAPCYRLQGSAATPTIIGGVMLGLNQNSNSRVPMGVSGVATPGVGTFNFGMCYSTSSATWNNNEYGYVSTTVLNF